MDDHFYIYSKRIEDFDEILQAISDHIFEDFYRRKNHREHAETDERDKIHHYMREVELKSHRIAKLISLRNKLQGLNQEFQSMKTKLRANQTILKTISRIGENSENPFVHILKDEIDVLEILLKEFDNPIMIIYDLYGRVQLFHLKSKTDRNGVIDCLMEGLSDSNDDLIENYHEYFTQSSFDELRFHNIDIEEAVKVHNEKVKQEIENKRIQQCWEITYEVKYTIPNLLSIMQSEEWEDKIDHYRNCKVQGDSIIFEYTSEEELTGIDIHPDEENLSLKLYNECLELYEAYLSDPYELDLLERIIDKTGQYELKITDYCFGNE
jgi:hypothetical protein